MKREKIDDKTIKELCMSEHNMKDGAMTLMEGGTTNRLYLRMDSLPIMN
jgi:hypothetical protein